MIKERYEAPASEVLGFEELALICTSGDGGIDDAGIVNWGDF